MSCFRTVWRDSQEWERCGLPFSTTSNETCKLYDAVLSQYVGWYEDDNLGGLGKSAEKLLQTDPNWVMGHVMTIGLDLMGTGKSIHRDAEFKKNVDLLAKIAEGSSVNEREKKHAKAINFFAHGDMIKACNTWEEIMVSHPTDMLAIKFAYTSYFYLGHSPQLRDSIARVLPYWNKTIPLYGYLKGMHSFGLVETNFYGEAEKASKEGLELNRCDAWSTHSLAHVLEMGGRQDEGVAFMSKTMPDWKKCGILACHNFWHWALFHLEKGDYSAALDIYDSEISNYYQSGTLFNIVDASSLLYRLEMEGVNLEGRWGDLFEVSQPHFDDHILAFNDIHLLMTSLGAGQTEATKRLLDPIWAFLNDNSGTQANIFREVGISMTEAFVAYQENDFETAVNKFLPIRYNVVNIGGSNAQRDLFNLFLIHSAMKSPNKKHQKLARQLLVERKFLKESAPMTDRLMAKAIATHSD